jgi:hypothetical protein
VSRSDFTSPFDSLLATNQPHWIDWLDDLIVADDSRADDRLMFGAFVKRHAGLDPLGGVWRGGTLVLAYDDGGRVVADFTVPYPCAEVEEDEPVEPPLTRPPYRPTTLIGKPVRVVRPVELKLDDRFVHVRQDIQKDLLVQTASVEGLVKGLQFQKPGKAGALAGATTGDVLLDALVRDVEVKRLQVEDLREITAQPGATPEVRDAAEASWKKAQGELALAVSEATDRMVTKSIDPQGGTAVEATAVLTSGVSAIRDTTALGTLKTNLDRIEGVALGAHIGMVEKLKLFGGFRG